jgi:hypothetical protein
MTQGAVDPDEANGSRECAPSDERNCARTVMTGSTQSGIVHICLSPDFAALHPGYEEACLAGFTDSIRRCHTGG